MILRKIYRLPGFPCKNITNKLSLIENKEILVFPLNLQIWFHNINVDVLDPVPSPGHFCFGFRNRLESL
jgi:hypothetical protein